MQKTLTYFVRGSIPVPLVSSLTCLDEVSLLHSNTKRYSYLVENNPDKLKASRAVILPLAKLINQVRVLCKGVLHLYRLKVSSEWNQKKVI